MAADMAVDSTTRVSAADLDGHLLTEARGPAGNQRRRQTAEHAETPQHWQTSVTATPT